MKEIIIRKVVPEDAQALIDLLKILGAESDNLTFGKEGLPITVEMEREYLESVTSQNDYIFYVATLDGEIVGDCSCTRLTRRMSHRAELSIGCAKKVWGRHVASRMMEKMIQDAKAQGIEQLFLGVRSDNDSAIRLYKKYGFIKTGDIPNMFKIDGVYADGDYMVLDLREKE